MTAPDPSPLVLSRACQRDHHNYCKAKRRYQAGCADCVCECPCHDEQHDRQRTDRGMP